MYIPLSQIESNLYTAGGEFILLSTSEEYIGPYFKTSKGKFYSGQSPQDENVQPLIQRDNVYKTVTEKGEPADYDLSYNLAPQAYVNATGNSFNAKKPIINSIPQPTATDYENTAFQRYFLKKNTNYQYSETNQNEYELFETKNSIVQFTSYTPLQLSWNIKGKLIDVYKQNYNTVKYKAETNKWIKFEEYFKWRFAKYYRGNKDDINYTEGGELKTLDTNQEYVGYYHVHPQRGVIMEGRFHQPTPHSILIPIIEGEVLNNRKKLGATDEVGTSRRRNIPRGGY